MVFEPRNDAEAYMQEKARRRKQSVQLRSTPLSPEESQDLARLCDQHAQRVAEVQNVTELLDSLIERKERPPRQLTESELQKVAASSTKDEWETVCAMDCHDIEQFCFVRLEFLNADARSNIAPVPLARDLSHHRGTFCRRRVTYRMREQRFQRRYNRQGVAFFPTEARLYEIPRRRAQSLEPRGTDSNDQA